MPKQHAFACGFRVLVAAYAFIIRSPLVAQRREPLQPFKRVRGH